ncbi:hypothetical protein [Micromonospora sp. ATCC 39149]|nr:hypothetical protein [Micromonospora sp. ATCC 39149]
MGLAEILHEVAERGGELAARTSISTTGQQVRPKIVKAVNTP